MSKLATWPLMLAVALIFSGICQADDRTDADALLEQVRITLQNFSADPDMRDARSALAIAQGVIIVPKYTRAGLVIGGAGGRGALLSKDADGNWAGPVFYEMGAASLGLQAGMDVAEVFLVILTEGGIDRLLKGNLELGADVGVAAGPIGAGASASTAEILGYSRSKGLFLGVSFAGSVLKPLQELNQAYYGQVVSPADVVITHSVSNPAAESLLSELKSLAEES